MNFVTNLRQLTLSPRLRKSKRLRAAIYLVLAAILYVTFVGDILPARYSYHADDVATSDIRAPIDAVDTYQTGQLSTEALAKVTSEYNLDPSVKERVLSDTNKLYDAVNQQLTQKDSTANQKLNNLTADSPYRTQLSTDNYSLLLSLPQSSLDDLRRNTQTIVNSVLSQKYTDNDYNSRESAIDNLLLPLDLDKQSRLALKAILMVALKPNMVFDAQKTELDKAAALKQIQPVRITKGDLIIRKGELITPLVMSQLKDLNLLYESPNYRMYIGFAVLILFLLGLLEASQYLFRTLLLNNNLLLLLLSIVIVFSALAMKLVEIVAYNSPNTSFAQNAGYLVPVALGALLSTVLFDIPQGFIVTILLSLLTGVEFDFRYQFLFVALFSGIAAVFSVARVKHRLVIMQAGVWVALINVLAIGSMQALLSATDGGLSGILESLLFGVMNGFISSVLTIGTLPFLESAFGLLTPVRLLELSDPNHPLLKKLLMEAPGSYHHSLIVGNLAEAAAETVGANALLCRVGSYFHDVGKTKRPAFFIENQFSRDNPHDKLAPSLSHLIITSHVKDGLEMLEQYRLPKPIRDICEQHHGTTILQYFYHKAVEADTEKGNTIEADLFRYPGPKPQTKEAAIVMLCDAVEATVRGMSRPTPNRIEAVIRKIIRERLNDGQLDECDLTLKDLDKAAEAFMLTLNGIYHNRIEYPDTPELPA
ncbi:MAG: metal-dependent phosphohydrolase [Bacilli bacterium]|nr:metal-dependent phosphohydrolase [Bacilli bacterium]